MIDIGLNLTSSQFNSDRAALIQRAQAAGVQHFLITGTSLVSSQQALALTYQNFSCMRSTAGVHPHAAKTWNTTTAAAVEALVFQEGVAAVGECGLDYDRMLSSIDEQRVAFEAQLDMAVRHNKPAFLHFRPAHGDSGEALTTFLAALKPRVTEGLRAVVHCFTADERTLNAMLDLGFYIGITGWVCDERRGASLQALLPNIPDDRLMLETDAPYLLPRTMPGAKRMKRNEPAFLPFVAADVAGRRGQSIEDLIKITTGNVQRCFGWPLLTEAGGV